MERVVILMTNQEWIWCAHTYFKVSQVFIQFIYTGAPAQAHYQYFSHSKYCKAQKNMTKSIDDRTHRSCYSIIE